MQNNQILTCAESCTGGWIAKAITDLPGSSAIFDRGFVTYSNRAKQEMLGVTGKTLEQHGAVSQQTVKEMAEGALSHSGATMAVSVSGIAGPTGGTADKPVGTVWIGWSRSSSKQLVTHCQRHHFKGDRTEVRQQSVITAFQGLIDMLATHLA